MARDPKEILKQILQDMDSDTAEFLKENMPTLKEVAPDDYDTLLGTYSRIGDKYTERANSLMKEKGFSEDDIKYAPGAGAVAAVIVAVVVAQYVDKASGGKK